mmetsp:Transcript_46886/g.56377  ORF Transcript_46886/g.56377 Transcript_46886/m.56377 type:complete len:434 (+) Transcript_46886:492-1793(+)
MNQFGNQSQSITEGHIKCGNLVPRVAGLSTRSNIGEEGGTKACLNPNKLLQSPQTPDHIRKWRKSNSLDPGKRVIHPAAIDDFRNGHGQDVVFGAEKVHDSGHIEDIFSNYAETECEEVKRETKELVYKSKQFSLGKSYSRGHILPDFMNDDNFRHGVKSAKTDNDAKALLYPNIQNSENSEECNLETSPSIRSQHNSNHGSDKPGEQRRRNYNWGGVDPSKNTFGIKSMDSSDRGSGKGVRDSLQMDYDAISRSDLRISLIQEDVFPSASDSGHIFGKATSQGRCDSARDCLMHLSSDEKAGGSSNVGKSVTPGFRNAHTETRSFGCPSIRHDIPKYAHHSVADNQNYGDDVSAEYLLRPSKMLTLGLSDDEFDKPRSREYIQAIMKDCGYDIDSETFETIFSSLCLNGDQLTCSLNQFRHQYNTLHWEENK